MKTCHPAGIALILVFCVVPARAGMIEYGNENLLNTGGIYPTDPKIGATLEGLAPGTVTDATNSFGHTFPFTPSAGDFPGTDQVFVGSNQTATLDGYAGFAGRQAGPQTLTLDYSSLVSPGQAIQMLTLGIASDDFQAAFFGQPFSATINGTSYAPLTNKLNALNDGGPVEHFFTIGIDPSLLLASNVLTLSIDEGGNGGDGWAVDFITVGVTTSAPGTPEPASLALLSIGALGFGLSRLCRGRAA